MSTTPDLINPTVAGEISNCHARTIRRRVDAGELTAYRLGPKGLHVDRAEVEKMTEVKA